MGSAAGKRSSAEPTFKKSQPLGQSQWAASGSQIVRTHHKEKGSGVGRTSDPGAWSGRRRGGCGGLVAVAGQAVGQTRTPPASGGWSTAAPGRSRPLSSRLPHPSGRHPVNFGHPAPPKGPSIQAAWPARPRVAGPPCRSGERARSSDRGHSGTGTPAAGMGWVPTCLRLLSKSTEQAATDQSVRPHPSPEA